MNIEYTFRAREDLREIYEYITYELLVPETAKKLAERIMADIRSLENMPGRYPLYNNEPLHTRRLHFLPVKNYLVFFTIQNETETVSIVRIMYNGRDLDRQLEELIDF